MERVLTKRDHCGGMSKDLEIEANVTFLGAGGGVEDK